MKSWTNIEQKMNLMANAHSVTPPAAVWSGIESELNKNNKKDRLLIILFLGIAGLGFLYFGAKNSIFTNIGKNKQETSIAFIEKETSEKTTALTDRNNDKSINTVISDNEGNQNNNVLPDKNTNTVFIAADDTKESITKESVTKEAWQKTLISEVIKKEPAKTIEKEVESNLAANIDQRTKLSLTDLSSINTTLSAKERKLLFNNKVECPTFKKSMDLHPFVELNGVIGIPSKSFGQSTLTDLVMQREETESTWYLWGGNIAIGINISPQFYVGAGIDFTQSKDKFNLSKEGITKVIITYDPETNEPIDTSIIMGDIVNKGEIRYNAIDFPVFVGFNKNFGNWEAGIELGVLWNLSFKASGKIVDPAGEVSTISDSGPVYKDKLGMGYKASLVLRKYYGNGISFHAKPTFKGYLSEINHDDYDIPTSLRQFRLDIGVRKDF